jgi:MFS family permease
MRNASPTSCTSRYSFVDPNICDHSMSNERSMRAKLKTPRAAAIAGIIFSVLFVAAFSMLRISVPSDPTESGEWLKTSSGLVGLALNLLPFAGIAFLWFVGALRDRLGQLEDRFFATVFLGSSLLFLAMLFILAAIVGAIILTFAADPRDAMSATTFHFARTLTYNVVNIYMIKMAGVFMMSTSTVVVYTGIAPRWVAYLGFALALLLLFGSSYFSWIFVAFAFWVFLISACLLIEEFLNRRQVSTTKP